MECLITWLKSLFVGPKVEAVPLDITEYSCDVCFVGSVEYTGVQLDALTPRYVHKCGVCGEETTLPTKFPRVKLGVK